MVNYVALYYLGRVYCIALVSFVTLMVFRVEWVSVLCLFYHCSIVAEKDNFELNSNEIIMRPTVGPSLLFSETNTFY